MLGELAWSSRYRCADEFFRTDQARAFCSIFTVHALLEDGRYKIFRPRLSRVAKCRLNMLSAVLPLSPIVCIEALRCSSLATSFGTALLIFMLLSKLPLRSHDIRMSHSAMPWDMIALTRCVYG